VTTVPYCMLVLQPWRAGLTGDLLPGKQSVTQGVQALAGPHRCRCLVSAGVTAGAAKTARLGPTAYQTVPESACGAVGTRGLGAASAPLQPITVRQTQPHLMSLASKPEPWVFPMTRGHLNPILPV